MHLASDQKDLLISQLKAEIFEIQQRDKDYLALRDQLHNIQSKYRHLQDEKVTPPFNGLVTPRQRLQDEAWLKLDDDTWSQEGVRRSEIPAWWEKQTKQWHFPRDRDKQRANQ